MQCISKEEFLEGLLPQYGGEKTGWKNYNGNLEEPDAWVLDFQNLDQDPQEVISAIWKYNRKHVEKVIAVPVAGYDTPEAHWYDLFLGVFCSKARKRRTEDEFAESFSLSRFTTAINADIAFRVSKAAQFMHIVDDDDERYLEVSPGVTVDKAEKFLDKRGLAFRPRMTTLHKASLAGIMANGCYGPSDAPCTEDIKELTVVKPNGKTIVLSATKNPKRFSVLRDAHLGASFFVTKIKIPVVPQFTLERRNILYQDVADLAEGLRVNDWMVSGHYMAMFIPVDMDEKEGHRLPRIRVTTLKQTSKKHSKCRKYSDVSDYFSLFRNEAGEPIIDLVTKTNQLRQYTPWLLKFAAISTYGFAGDVIECGKSHVMYHPLRAYTDSIFNINWLIQVQDLEEARELHIELFGRIEEELKELDNKGVHPILNLFARLQGGVHFSKGEGGVAPTAKEEENQYIFSFEFVTFMPLAKTEAVQDLIQMVEGYLEERGNKYVYHYPKHMPEHIDSLTQMLTDDIGRQRLENFQQAIIKMHGGKKNLKHSMFLTPQKRRFIGFPSLKSDVIQHFEEPTKYKCSEGQEAEALKKIIKEAKKNRRFVNTKDVIIQAKEQLTGLKS